MAPAHRVSLIAGYLALAGLGRFTIELFRTNPALLGPLTNVRVVAIASVVLKLSRAPLPSESQLSLANSAKPTGT